MPTPTPQSTSRLHVADATNGVPRLSGDIRHLIPKLGLRNYWYPAIEDRTVGRRKPDQCDFLETWSFNSNKCFALFQP